MAQVLSSSLSVAALSNTRGDDGSKHLFHVSMAEESQCRLTNRTRWPANILNGIHNTSVAAGVEIYTAANGELDIRLDHVNTRGRTRTSK